MNTPLLKWVSTEGRVFILNFDTGRYSVIDGKKADHLPSTLEGLADLKPVYKTFKGWNKKLTEIRSAKELPKEVADYVQFIGTEIGIPIDVISVGPDREQTLWIKPLFTD